MVDPLDTSPPLQANASRPPSFSADDLLALVTGLSRFMYQLARVPAFRDFGLGLAEWAALSLLSHDEAIDDRRLGALLGLTDQRLRHLKAELEAAHLISIVASTGHPGKTTVVVTQRARLYLEDINAVLIPAVKEALRSRPNAALAFDKTMVALGEILKVTNRDNAKRKKKVKKHAGPST